jgi:DNA invertase Pin-like site-specific DNA recombinase
MKVAVYTRVSTKDQDADKQERLCRKYCEIQSHDIFKFYTDITSGTKESRPQWNLLLNDMRLYKFRGLVVTKLDRIGRSLKHLVSLFEEFNNKRVEFIAVTQNLDTTTSAGKLQMQIMGAFAEYEANIISERTKEALKFAKNVGKRGKDKKPRRKRGALRK